MVEGVFGVAGGSVESLAEVADLGGEAVGGGWVGWVWSGDGGGGGGGL